MGVAALPLVWAERGPAAALESGGWGLDLQHISGSARPGNSFFDYVNEGWLRTAERPAGYNSYGELNAMYLRTEPRIAEIIAADASAGGKMAALYRSYTDLDALDRAGIGPIRSDLDAILAIRDHEGVARRMAHPMSHSIVGLYVFLDAKNTRRSLVHLDQQMLGPKVLGLPSPAYYAETTEPYPAHRDAYRAYISETLGRVGVSDGERRARDILALETRLATAQWTGEQLRDRRLNYHLLKWTDLAAYAPGFPWAAFMAATGAPAVDEIVLNTDTAVRASAAIFAETPVEVWRSYLLFHWVHNHAHLLPEAFRDAGIAFYNRRLRNQQTIRSRADSGVRFVNDNLPDLVGKAYVARYFSSAQRTGIEQMFTYLKRAFDKRLDRADWLDSRTRAIAKAKLGKMSMRLGYPDDLRDYADIPIRADDPIGNVHRLAAAQRALDWGYLTHPKRPYRWHLPPQTVDGSFSPQMNAITFPAGILQPPAYDLSADPAVNFGAIGAVLGHEISHAFDDQGSRFDDEGNLLDWWTPETRAAFDTRAETLVAQYDGYEVLPGEHLNGRRSLGENLADLLGLSIALDAYRLYAVERRLDPKRKRDGFTGEQRFFLGWAQLWRSLSTPESLHRSATADYHSPSRFRVDGVVRNLDAWYAAFDVKPGDTLYLPPDRRAQIW